MRATTYVERAGAALGEALRVAGLTYGRAFEMDYRIVLHPATWETIAIDAPMSDMVTITPVHTWRHLRVETDTDLPEHTVRLRKQTTVTFDGAPQPDTDPTTRGLRP